MSNPNVNPFAGQSKTHKCLPKKHAALVAKRYHVIRRQNIQCAASEPWANFKCPYAEEAEPLFY
jgi:hypothetical protein